MKRWLHLLALLAWVSVAGNLPAQVDSIHMSEMNGADHGSWHIRVPLNVIVITQIAPPANTVLGGKYWAMDSLSQSQGKLGSVADILRELPSFNMKRYAPGGLSSPTMRGTGAGHTQIFWEGLPLNSPLLGQQDFALSGGGLFNHVEARYGGNSLLQGAGGLGGAILLGSTSAANDLKPIAISFSQQVGSFGSIGSHLYLHFASKHFTSSTKVYWNSARNDFPFVNSGKLGNPVERLPNAAIQQMGVLQEFGYMWKRHQFNLKIWALHSERNLPPTMLALNTLESQGDRALRSLLTWRQYLRQVQLKTDVAYFQEQLTYRNPTAGILAPSSFGRIMAESQVMRHSGSEPRLRPQKAGLRFVHDQAFSDGYAGAAQQTLLSAFGYGELHLGKGKNTLLGLVLREELNNDKLSPLLGCLGLNVGKLIQFQANLSRNYRQPTLNDRYWVPGGNPGLRPEQSHSAELGFQRLRMLDSGNMERYSVGAYWNDVQDWIIWLPSTGNLWTPENVQHVQARGIEAQYQRRDNIRGIFPEFWYDISLHYNFNDSRNQDGDQLIYTPQHNASFRLHLDWARWSLHYFQDWNSRRFTTADNSAFIPGFSTGDLSLGCRLGKARPEVGDQVMSEQKKSLDPRLFGRFHVQAGIRNLWNAQFQTVAWRPMPGRSFFLRLDADLWKLRRNG